MKKITTIISLLASFVCAAQTNLQDMQNSSFLPESNPDFEFNYTDIKAQEFDTFEQAAEWADVVAIAQLNNVDYTKTRDLNAKGQAFLTVRVGYKGTHKNELLIVNSKGFESDACYFPDKEGIEGQRFLVFLKATDSVGEYVGFKPMCQLPILLDDMGRYAMKAPLEVPIKVAEELIKDMTYRDPHATIDVSEWTNLKRQEVAAKQHMVITQEEDMFRKYFYMTYTRGIMMYEIRKLMNITAVPRITSKQK